MRNQTPKKTEDHARAEAGLKKAERTLNSLLQAAGDTVMIVETSGKVLNINDAGAARLKSSPAKMSGKIIWDFMPTETAKSRKARLQELLSTNHPVHFQDERESMFFDIDYYPVFDEKGDIESVVVFARDITEQKAVERKFAAEAELLDVTLRSIADGVITTDVQGRIILVNRAAEKLTGWTREASVGQDLSKIFHVIDEKTSKQLENLLVTGQPSAIPNRAILIGKDGKRRAVEYNCGFTRDKDNKIVGAVLVFSDITEKRKMEEELIRENKLQSITIMAGGIAHEFNNIMMGILGNISLAKSETNPGAQIYEYLEGATAGCARARELTQQLLTFAKGGAPIKTIIHIEDLIRGSANFMLKGSKSKVEFSFPQNLWTVEVDEGQMSQVINNLIINADQAMPEGGKITAGAENVILDKGNPQELEPGNYVRIFVQDRGKGIPKENLEKIFDPFFSEKESGSGIGLAITQSIVKNHGGAVDVKSEKGVGTIFYVYIPASQKEASTAEKTEIKLTLGRGRVLIMDDEDVVRDMGAKMLKRLGYSAGFAKDGEEAIEKYKQAKQAGEPFECHHCGLGHPRRNGRKRIAQKIA